MPALSLKLHAAQGPGRRRPGRWKYGPFGGGPVAALCWSTFLEAARDRVLYLLLFFGAFVFAASRLLAPLALGQGRRLMLDLGFTAISAFGCLTTIFVGHQLIFREVERKTLYFLFSRPLRRGEFVWGKYLGLLLILSASVLVMGLLFALVLAVSGHPFGWSFVPALFLGLLEFVVLGAVAVLLACMTSPVLAGLFTLAAWVIGHGCADLGLLLQHAASPALRQAVRVLIWALPRLDLFSDIEPVLRGASYPGAQLLFAGFYAAAYAGAALIVAGFILNRRELAL